MVRESSSRLLATGRREEHVRAKERMSAAAVRKSQTMDSTSTFSVVMGKKLRVLGGRLMYAENTGRHSRCFRLSIVSKWAGGKWYEGGRRLEPYPAMVVSAQPLAWALER